MLGVYVFDIYKWPLIRLFHTLFTLKDHLACLLVTKTQDLFVSYNLAIEAEAQQFSELNGNKKTADNYSHSAATSYLLRLGRFEGIGYEVMKRMPDINCDSELFPEVMRYVSF